MNQTAHNKLVVLSMDASQHLEVFCESLKDIFILCVLQYGFVNYILFYAKIYNFKRDEELT